MRGNVLRRTRSTAAWRRTVAVLFVIVVVLWIVGCSRAAQVSESRPLLGTAISITAYGSDEAALQAGIDDAFSRMEEVALALDAYDPRSAIAAVNAAPYDEHDLPGEAAEVMQTVQDLGMGEAFDPALWGLTSLYDFGGGGSVPTREKLLGALDIAHSVSWGSAFSSVLFDPPFEVDAGLPSLPPPGLDFGGAAKGLALDRAAEALQQVDGLSGTLITAGSTAIALGRKPDGEPWRIGIEDPRDTERILAVIEASEGPFVVSTSGDYQQYFEADGVRYHHLLCPDDGEPARGIRSLTIAGDGISALEADILSTALFVLGRHPAQSEAEAHGYALHLVDGEGRAFLTPGPEGSLILIEERAEPLP